MKKITPLIIFLLIFCVKMRAQAVSGYSFTESTEVYSAVAGTNSTANGDDGVDDNNPIGFVFNFGGSEYSTFSISTNGFIRLGSNLDGNNYINVLDNAAAQTPLIAAFWDDHNRNAGAIQYSVSGIAPLRKLEVGWNNINISNGGNASAGVSGSFKMRIFETTGIIEFVYGPSITSAGAITASIGLNDMTSFLSVTPATSGATTSSITANNNISSTASVVGKKYIFTPQPQCSGAPNPGNTLASATTICQGFDFILSIENSSTEFGLSYQWQSSPDGSSFTDIPNATGSTLVTTQSASTFYRCEVMCTNILAFTNPVEILLTDPSACYCYPTYDNGVTDGDLISNVVIAGTTLSNNTGNTPVNPFYTYFTGQPNYTATLEAGLLYELSVTVGTYGQQNVAVWIDYNDDYNFSTDEQVGYSLNEIDSNGTGIVTITLACDPPAGLHRMRIRDAWNVPGDTLTPCGNYGYGETEDYDVTINAGSPCAVPFGLMSTDMNSNSAQISWNAGCGSPTWDVYVTTAGGGPPGTPTITNASNPQIITGLTPYTDYEFYVMSNCGAAGTSAWAGPYPFSTLPVAVANDECETSFSLTPGSTFDQYAMVATNVGATKTIGPPNPTCATFGFGGDVWFSIVVPVDGNVTVETQSDLGSPVIDTGLTVFSGICGAMTALGCSDDEGIDGFSRLNLTGLTPGSTIYARVWEYANDTFGTFRVSAWNAQLSTQESEMPSLRHYPNPVKDVLNLSFDKEISNVAIFNLLGQQIMDIKVNSSSSQINLETLSRGTYVVKVSADNLVKIIKVVKE